MRRIISEEQWRELYANYLAGKTVRQLAKELNSHVQTVYSGFVRHGFDRSVGFINRNADDNYFNGLKTCTEAYAFGLWLTDGSTTPNYWSIKLQSSDAPVLVAIADNFYKSPHNLLVDGNAVVFNGYSTIVATRLRKLFRGRKTDQLQLNLQEIPVEFRAAVLRGIFDGDGTISLRSERPNQRQVSICSISRVFLEQLQSWLATEHGIETSINIEKREGKLLRVPQGYTTCSHDMLRLQFGTHQARVKLFELMYAPLDDGPKIQRKYEMFRQYYDNAVQLLASKKPALPDAIVHAVYEQHLKGRSIRDISRELTTTSNTVVRWFNKHGLEVRSRVTHRD